MTTLVDTNVLAELTRREPHPGVSRWAAGLSRVAVSVITVEELAFGLAHRPSARMQAVYDDFLDRYCDVLPVTDEIARHAGRLRGELRARGIQRSQADMIIAATAIAHGLSIVTRNGRDFDGCGVAVLDPFA